MAKKNVNEMIDFFVANRDDKKLKQKFAQKFGLSEANAANYLWRIRSGRMKPSEPAATQPQEQPASTITPQTISASSIQVTAQPVKEEAKELSNTYQQMISGAGGVAPTDEIPQEDTGEIGDQAYSGEGGGGFTPPPEERYKIKIQALAKTLGIVVDDKVLFAGAELAVPKGKGRPLDDMEKKLIEDASADMEADISKGMPLNTPYAPYINYFASVIVLPAILRIDLIMEKVTELTKKKDDKNAKPKSVSDISANNNPAAAQNQEEANVTTVQPTEPAKPAIIPYDQRGLSPSTISWIQSLDPDYKVSPNYGTLQGSEYEKAAVDRNAFMQKIVRNPGDGWGEEFLQK